MKIEINKNRAGRISNLVFGVIEVLDGVVRIASLGFLHTDFCVSYARYSAQKQIKYKVSRNEE